MSTTQILVLAVAALLVFWMLGAYNRLVALRNAIGSAWHLVDEVLARRGEAALALASALRTPLAAEHGALDALLAAQLQVKLAADALRARPVQPTDALLAAESAMASATSRVLALLDLQTELAAQAGINTPAGVLRDSAARLAFARQLFNEAADAYNSATRQFPTRLLISLYGFGPAGAL